MAKRRVKEWFSRLLRNDPRSTGLSVTQRRNRAEAVLPRILAKASHGKEWEILRVRWTSPKPPNRRHRMTVILREKLVGGEPPPTNAILPQKPTTPPPSM